MDQKDAAAEEASDAEDRRSRGSARRLHDEAVDQKSAHEKSASEKNQKRDVEKQGTYDRQKSTGRSRQAK